MSDWKYTDDTQEVVFRQTDSGYESKLASALESGTAVLPPDPATAERLNSKIVMQLATLDAQRVRPLAEITLAQVAGEPIPLYAKAKLADIEKQAVELREKIVK